MSNEYFDRKPLTDIHLREIIRLREKARIDRSFELMDAREEGKLEGKLEGIQSVAKQMKERNLDISLIAGCTGLSESEISIL